MFINIDQFPLKNDLTWNTLWGENTLFVTNNTARSMHFIKGPLLGKALVFCSMMRLQKKYIAPKFLQASTFTQWRKMQLTYHAQQLMVQSTDLTQDTSFNFGIDFPRFGTALGIEPIKPAFSDPDTQLGDINSPLKLMQRCTVSSKSSTILRVARAGRSHRSIRCPSAGY